MTDEIQLFHIDSFPRKNIFIQLKPKFAGIFFSHILKNEAEVAQRVGIKVKLLEQYIASYSGGSESPKFLPLNVFLKLTALYQKSISEQDVIAEIEDNIQAVRGYLQGGRQWMSGRWVVALAGLVGWGVREVGDGVVVAFGSELTPRYEQCDFLGKAMMSYRWFASGKVGFEEWLGGRREVIRERRLLDAGFAEKLKNSGVIRVRILALAEAKGGEVSLEELRADSVLRQLVADRYGVYLADRMAKLVKQGVFARVRRGVYHLTSELGVG